MPKPHSFVVDVACGTAQGTRILSPYFDKVIGCDASPDQIKMAQHTEKLPNIEYRVGTAEDLPIESGTVDVLTVASAIHFFELDKFFKEADRYKETINRHPPATYLHPQLAISDEWYSLALPYEEVKRIDSLSNTWETTVRGFMAYIHSFTTTKAYLKNNPDDGPKVVQKLKEGILEAMDVVEDDCITTVTPLPLVMARKPFNI
ncbi:putative methyltransferase DDB_G0268948 [Glandiceps talaboti]